MWRFGRWESAAALAYSLYHDGDDLFVGKVLGASALGFYRMGYRLANMATTEGVNAIRKVLFPAFSRIQNDAARLRSAVLSLWEVGAFLGAAFSVALSATSYPLVRLLSGDQWLPMVPSLKVLAIWGGVQVLKTVTAPVFRSVNHPDWWAKSLLIRLAVLVALILSRIDAMGNDRCLRHHIAAAIVDLPFSIHWLSRALACPVRSCLVLLVVPIGAGSLSLLVNHFASPYMSLSGTWPQLLGSLGVALLSFALAALIGDQVLRTGIYKRFASLAKRQLSTVTCSTYLRDPLDKN